MLILSFIAKWSGRIISCFCFGCSLLCVLECGMFITKFIERRRFVIKLKTQCRFLMEKASCIITKMIPFPWCKQVYIS